MKDGKPITEIPVHGEIDLEATPDARKTLDEMRAVAGKSIFRTLPEEKGKPFLEQAKAKNFRWNQWHKVFKYKVAYPILRIISKHFRKNIISGIDDIEEAWYNNHLRMFYHCYEKAVYDMWEHMHYAAASREPGKKCSRYGLKDFKEYLEKNIRPETNQSHQYRLLLIKLFLTQAMEDTIDREVINFFLFNVYHEMHRLYDGKVPKPGEWPVYMSGTDKNPRYFIENRMRPVWKP